MHKFALTTMKRLILTLSVVLFAALLLLACESTGGTESTAASAEDAGSAVGPDVAPSETPPESSGQPGDTAEGEEQAKELVFASLPGTVHFDPRRAYTSTESQLYTAVYEGLVTYNPSTLEPEPGAARRWEISDDGRIYRFFLRENGRFSNGDPVTAKVFRDSWFRMLDPDAHAEYSTFFDIIKGARAFRTGQINDPDEVGIRVVSPYELEVELERPAAHFLKVLCHMSFVPIHPHYQRSDDWESNSVIVGNGPFFVYDKNDREIIFERNELYWDRANVGLDRIVVRYFSDPAAISEAFNQGLVQWADNWDTSALDNTDYIVFYPLFATSFYFVRSDHEPWSNASVRRALALLVPWQDIRTDANFSTARLVPAPSPDYPEVESIDAQDDQEALRLLEEAGYPQGRGLPELVMRIPSGGESERIAGIMADAWREALGMTVRLDPIDYSVYFASLKRDDYTIGQMTWIGDFADPLTFLQMWTSHSNLNDAHYRNPEYDKLVEEGTAISGLEERYKLFAQAESIILKTGVILPVSHQPSLNLVNTDRIEGWYPNLLDVHPFKSIRFKGPRVFPNLVMR